MYFSFYPTAAALHFHIVLNIVIVFAKYSMREANRKQKIMFLWTFSVRGGGVGEGRGGLAQPHSIAFGGVFTNFTKAIFR